MKISLVAVNFNNSGYTIHMIESLLEVIECISKIVIVDNDSRSDDFQNLIDYKNKLDNEKLFFVKSNENIGYFPGLNLGLAELDATETDFTIICNNDLIFNKNFFHILSELKIEPEVYAICPSVRTIDGVYQNPSLAEKPGKLRLMFYKLYFSNYFIGKMLLAVWRFAGLGSDSRKIKDNTARSIFIGIGAVYVLCPGFFKYNKRLHYPSFLYSEEVFFSGQVQESGGVQLYYPELEVTHAESVSTSSIPDFQKYKMTQSSFNLCKHYYDK